MGLPQGAVGALVLKISAREKGGGGKKMENWGERGSESKLLK